MMPLRFLLRPSFSLQIFFSSPPTRSLRLTSVCEKFKSKKSTGKSPDVGSDVNEDLKKAALKVANTLPGNPDKTASDLLKQLRAHAASSKDNLQESTKPVPSLGDLFSGMKVESANDSAKERDSSRPHQRRQREPREHRREVPRGLFEEKPLGIFGRREGSEMTSVSTVGKETLWDRVDREQLESLTQTPPLNAFEEMIQWTKEGKLWHFPIDNEQGMDEEAKYEFSDHIFFDELLEEFPKKGPIRHFMDLVIIGLSKNPYMTVPQKHDHIAWFKTYFEEKQSILDDVIGDSAQQK